MKWVQVLPHVGTNGDSRADRGADVGRHRSPLLFRPMPLCTPSSAEEYEERDEMRNEESMRGRGGASAAQMGCLRNRSGSTGRSGR